MSRRRLPTPAPPAECGVHHGLAFTLWLPDQPPWGAMVVVHGAGSCKEDHHDMARAARGAGLAAVCFDLRGYGHSVDLHARSAAPLKRLIVVPGGHHRSVQHDEELQGEALRFVRRAFAGATPPPR